MRTMRQASDLDGFASLDSADTRVLNTQEERELLRSLADCKRKLADALASIKGAEVPEGADDPQSLALFIAAFYAGDGPSEARLGAIFRRYSELRGKLVVSQTV